MSAMPTENQVFEPGPSVGESNEALRRWCEANASDGGKRIRLRIPVVFTPSPGAVFGERRSTLARPSGSAAEPLEFDLDDSALGVGLADRLRTLCPDSSECALWLEGYWGRLVELPGIGEAPRGVPFAVLEVGELLDAGEREEGELRLGRRRP